jgi:hypothetical protein
MKNAKVFLLLGSDKRIFLYLKSKMVSKRTGTNSWNISIGRATLKFLAEYTCEYGTSRSPRRYFSPASSIGVKNASEERKIRGCVKKNMLTKRVFRALPSSIIVRCDLLKKQGLATRYNKRANAINISYIAYSVSNTIWAEDSSLLSNLVIATHFIPNNTASIGASNVPRICYNFVTFAIWTP